jgi:hypothetical protein
VIALRNAYKSVCIATGRECFGKEIFFPAFSRRRKATQQCEIRLRGGLEQTGSVAASRSARAQRFVPE